MSKHINMKDEIKDLCEIISVLADTTRQEILMFFYTKDKACVTEIAGNFSLSRPTISHHLNLMKRLKVLNAYKQGKEIYYSFNKEFVIGSLNRMIELINKCC